MAADLLALARPLFGYEQCQLVQVSVIGSHTEMIDSCHGTSDSNQGFVGGTKMRRAIFELLREFIRVGDANL